MKIKELMEHNESCEVRIRLVKGNLSSKIDVVKTEFIE